VEEKDDHDDGEAPSAELNGKLDHENGSGPVETPTVIKDEQEKKLKVFISHGKNHDVVEQISTMLDLADIESEIAEAEETTAIPVSDKVLDAMRRCGAGIIAVTVEESRKDKDGNYVLNDNVLIEIGAAFVLYERRVVLVWDKRLKVPSNLQGLYRCEFEGDELSWSTGMKLMKAIQKFKQP
jgi:predicted nucleotide-binding protein